MLLKLVLVKKLVEAFLLLVVAFFATVGSRHYVQLPLVVDQLTGADRQLLAQLAHRAVAAGPDRLELVGAGAGIYAQLILIAALATWRRAPWGEWLMVAVFLSALPMEIWEITKQPSIPHGLVLALTLLGLGLLLWEMGAQGRPLPLGRGRRFRGGRR